MLKRTQTNAQCFKRLWPWLLVGWLCGQVQAGLPLRVTNDNAAPPYSYLDAQGQPQGRLIELWRQIGEDLDRPVEFLLLDWPDTLQALRLGQVDVHAGLVANSERQAYMQFSEPLFQLDARPFLRKAFYQCCVEQLSSLPLGVVSGSFEHHYLLDQQPLQQLLVFRDTQALQKAIVSGTLEGFVVDGLTGQYMLAKNRQLNHFTMLDPYYQRPMVAGIGASAALAPEELNASLARLASQMRSQAIDTDTLQPLSPWLILPWLLVMVALLSFALYRRRNKLKYRREQQVYQKKLAEQDQEQQLLRTVAQLSSAGIFIIRGQYFSFVNPALCELCGQSQQELLARPFWQFVHRQDRSGLSQLAKEGLREGQQEVRLTLRLMVSHQRPIWVDLYLKRIQLLDEDFVTGTIVDVHRFKVLEDQLLYNSGLNEMLADLSAELLKANAQNIGQSMQSFLTTIGQFFQVDRAYLFRIDDDSKTLSNTHEWCARGVKPFIDQLQNISLESFSWFHQELQHALTQGRVFAVENVEQMPDEALVEREHFKLEGIVSLIGVPIASEGRLVGFFGFDSLHLRKWPDLMANKLKEISGMLATVLEHSTKESELWQASQTDPLSGLYNRRYLDQKLPEQMQLAQVEQLNLAVAMIDIDYFKEFNDNYGHLAGDDIIKQFAQLLLAQLRQGDEAVRYGGEEFLLLINRANCEQASVVVGRILSRLRTQNFVVDGQEHQILASAGLACLNEIQFTDGNAMHQLIELADDRLYRAKQRGRNCLVYDNSEPFQ